MSSEHGEETGTNRTHPVPLDGVTVFRVGKKPKVRHHGICKFCNTPFVSYSASTKYHPDCQISNTELNWKKKTMEQTGGALSTGWSGMEAYKKQCEESWKRNK